MKEYRIDSIRIGDTLEYTMPYRKTIFKGKVVGHRLPIKGCPARYLVKIGNGQHTLSYKDNKLIHNIKILDVKPAVRKMKFAKLIGQ
jgi:hypothetical protein